MVNETIYPQIKENLNIFEQDLRNEGYNVQKTTVSSQAAPPQIKEIIKSHYSKNNLIGVILVGDIKAAYAELWTGDYSNPNALKITISLDATI